MRVPDATIGAFEGLKVLIVERFDRQWSADGSWLIRLPQEDLCQALDYSPGQKYESDGGPGISKIMEVLLQSTNSFDDRAQFMRSQIFFWILAAPDGHAKNFSIFLAPGGRFKLTPFYDIISAYPLLDKGEIQPQKLRLTMAALGANKHYRWRNVLQRHWISTAVHCGFPKEEIEKIMREFATQAEEWTANVRRKIPHDFPKEIAESILQGVLNKCNAIT